MRPLRSASLSTFHPTSPGKWGKYLQDLHQTTHLPRDTGNDKDPGEAIAHHPVPGSGEGGAAGHSASSVTGSPAAADYCGCC